MMKGEVLELFSAEILKSYRGSKERIKEHPVITTWFIILLFAGFGTALSLTEYAAALDNPLIKPSRGDILFTFFFFIFAKASAETVDNTLRNKELKHVISSPINLRKIVLSRIARIFWYNLLLVGISASIVSIIIPVLQLDLPIDFYFIPHLYLLLIIAPVIGFNIAVFIHLNSLKKRVISLFIYGQNITMIWYLLHINVGAQILMVYLSVIGIISFAVHIILPSIFLESWKYGTQTSSSTLLRFHEAGDFLPKIFSKSIRNVAEKEILIRWRRRESPASIAVISMIGLGLLFFYNQFGPNPDLNLELEEYFYPVLIGIGLYTAITLHQVLPSLTLFSREGRKMWSLKTLPIDPKEVVWGKVIALLTYSPIIPLLIALPLPLVLGYPISVVLFSFFASLAMIFSFLSIGIWASAKFPNFDESVDGAPDVITMYIVLMGCLFLGVIFIALPFGLMHFDRVLGVLGMIFFADFAALMLVFIIGRSAKIYDSLQLDF